MGLRVEGMGIEEVMVVCFALLCSDMILTLAWSGLACTGMVRVATSASKVGML